MKQPWNPSEGFKVRSTHFEDGIIFEAFANNVLTAGDALNMLISVIIKTGVFQAQYEEWDSLPKPSRCSPMLSSVGRRRSESRINSPSSQEIWAEAISMA